MADLELKNLSIRFGGVLALNNLSLSVQSGTFVGLMGPNGSGKTTVINCISRIYEPEQGEIFYDGHNLRKMSGDQIVGLGISRTFQDLSFLNRFADMMVIDYLKLGQFGLSSGSFFGDGLWTKKSRLSEAELKKRGRETLEFFRELRDRNDVSEKERGYPYLYGREGFPDLLDLEYRPLGMLSFAWRRRLDLARALVSRPRLLLLDEPAQGLPPSEIENLGKTLKVIQKELGVAALIVEHNVGTLTEISDKIVAMNLGSEVITGTPQEVSNHPEVIEVYLGKPAEKNTSASIEVVQKPKERSKTEIPLLELQNIDLYYGLAQALFSVSMKFYPRQIATIIGSNGSGKSSLLKVMSGIEKPAYGQILFKGEPIVLGEPEMTVEQGIQYVPQGHVIFPELTVLANLKIGSYVPEKKGIKFSDSMERVLSYFPGLEPHMNKQAASLSGGQRQMLAIGQAIMARPEVLLVDEPTLGLSPAMVEMLFEIIQKMAVQEECTIILVEQNVRKTLEVSDYVYMMSSGVLVGEGSKQSLDDAVIKKHLGFL